MLSLFVGVMLDSFPDDYSICDNNADAYVAASSQAKPRIRLSWLHGHIFIIKMRKYLSLKLDFEYLKFDWTLF